MTSNAPRGLLAGVGPGFGGPHAKAHEIIHDGIVTGAPSTRVIERLEAAGLLVDEEGRDHDE